MRHLAILALLAPWPLFAQESAVASALMAQVQGLGGCDELEKVDTLSVPYWPTLSFYRGRCTLEHGYTALPWAVRLSDGSVLPLGSRTAFRYLLRRVPPIGITEETRLDYVHRALVWMGKVPELAELPGDPKNSVSPALCDLVGLKCSGLFTPHFDPVPSRPQLVEFVLTFVTADAIYSTGPSFLNTDTGTVDAVVARYDEGGKTHQ